MTRTKLLQKIINIVYGVFSAVYPDGRVCISILHAPGDDPMGYESSAERWSPVQSVEKILLSVVSMLAGQSPFTQSSVNDHYMCCIVPTCLKVVPEIKKP